MKSLTIGSRGSKLALTQTNMIGELLQKLNPGLSISVKIIKTTGDRFLETSTKELAALTKGIFVKEIEEALLTGNIDLAVHSLKDMPVETPNGLEIAAMPIREDPRDVLISSRQISSFMDLPEKARIATGSPRRSEQLKQLRPDFEILPLRGNVDTRIRKLADQGLDAIVLAASGLKRMALEKKITCYLDPDKIIPAPGQGCLAIETLTRSKSPAGLKELLSKVDHAGTRAAVNAERKFQARMGAGCSFPLGAYAEVRENSVSFHYFVGYPEQGNFFSGTISGSLKEIDKLVDTAINKVLEASD